MNKSSTLYSKIINWAESLESSIFPITDLVGFLKSVIIKKNLPPNIVLSIKYQEGQWDDNILYDLSMDFITEDLLRNNKLEYILKVQNNDKGFKNAIAKYFIQYIYRKTGFRTNDTAKLRNLVSDTLNNHEEFKIFKKSKQVNNIVWGLKKWSDSEKNIIDIRLDELITQIPYYGHLRVIPKQNSKNNSPIIYAKDLLKLLLLVFNEVDLKLLFRDLFYIIKKTIGIAENEIISGYKTVSKEDDRELTVFDKIYDDNEEIFTDDDKEFIKESAVNFVNNLSERDLVILKLGIFDKCTDLDIEESNGIPRSTVAHVRNKLVAQIKNLIFNDQDIFIELCNQIRNVI